MSSTSPSSLSYVYFCTSLIFQLQFVIYKWKNERNLFNFFEWNFCKVTKDSIRKPHFQELITNSIRKPILQKLITEYVHLHVKNIRGVWVCFKYLFIKQIHVNYEWKEGHLEVSSNMNIISCEIDRIHLFTEHWVSLCSAVKHQKLYTLIAL